MAKNDKPQASKIATKDKIKEDDASCPCYAWGKLCEQDHLILFDSGCSNCNFISQELASKLGIHAQEMGLAIEADGAFDTLSIPVTPLIAKLRLHVQGYVDQEEIIEQVDELVEKGMVCPSSSPFSHPCY